MKAQKGDCFLSTTTEREGLGFGKRDALCGVSHRPWTTGKKRFFYSIERSILLGAQGTAGIGDLLQPRPPLGLSWAWLERERSWRKGEVPW